VKEGDRLLALGDFAGARGEYQEALGGEPGKAEWLLKLAHVETKDGNWDAAVKLLEEATAKPDAPIEAWLLLGEVRGRKQEWAQAALAYERYLEKKPEETMTRLELARALAALAEADPGARPRAVAAYEKVIADAKQDPPIVAQAREELFAVRYGAAGQLFREGKSAIESGDFREAIRTLEEVTKKIPELEEAYYLLGVAYAAPEIGRRGEAMKMWERAAGLPQAHLQIGMQLHDSGDLTNAEARYQKAVGIDPRYQEGWLSLGDLHSERGDTDKAVQAWNKAAAIDEKSDLGRWARSRLAVATGSLYEPFEEGVVIDPATELVLGQKLVEAIGAHRGFVDDERLLERLDRIFQRLVAVTDRGDITYRLYVYKDPMPNAYALPGGTILLPTGMIDVIRTRLGDRDELYAALLGHELAHSSLRHSPEGLRLAQARKGLSAPELRRVMAELTLRATRQQEYEADKYGALYMYRAGYNPKYMRELWEKAPVLFGPSRPGGDHATHEERAARMRDALIELRGRTAELERGNKEMAAGNYAAAQRRYEVFLAVLPRSAPGRLNYAVALHKEALARLGTDAKWRQMTDVDPDARAPAVEVHGAEAPATAADPRVKQRRLREAEVAYRRALELDGKYVLAMTNYGALLTDRGETKHALKVLGEATRFAPRSAAAWTHLGVAYAQSGDRGRAKKALETAAKLDPKVAEPWWNLAVLAEDSGKKDDAMAAWDEAIRRDGASAWGKAAKLRRDVVVKLK
jgi:predicted Zn-dependent protease